jgi:hypothetical protein
MLLFAGKMQSVHTQIILPKTAASFRRVQVDELKTVT